MNLRPLGSSGVDVPAVGFGTWLFDGVGTVIQHAIDAGAWLIDTAEWYRNEDMVGAAIRGRRNEVFLATKINPWNLRGPDVIAACDRSLRALGVDTIDLYQIHAPNPQIPASETMEAMDRLVAAGKVRFVGVSNFDPTELAEADAALGSGRIVSDQIKLSLLDHDLGDSVIPYCAEHGISVIAYSTLEKGAFDQRVPERPGLGETVDRIRSEVGCTTAQLMLDWALHHPRVLTIPMTTRAERIAENVTAGDIRLTGEQHSTLTEAAGPAVSPSYWWRS